MRPKKITVTGVGTSNWIPVDYKQDPFSLSVGCVIVSGSATYTVEYTYDDVLDPAVTSPVAFALSSVSAATTSKDGVISQPVRAVRLNTTAGTSPVVSLALMQGQR